MKRLLVLVAVTLAAGASGCKNCSPCGGSTSAFRPYTPTPACCGGGTVAAPGAVYAAPGMQAPAMGMPQGVPVQTYPGPEAYTPAP